MNNVGVIGNGFVGNSIYHTFSPQFKVFVYDLNPVRSTHSLRDTIVNSDIIFMCVPTPMKKDGTNDVGYVNTAFADILKLGIELKEKVFVLKSTVIPGTTDRLSLINAFNLVFSPEFLTERTAVADSICANHVIIGSDTHEVAAKVAKLYKDRFGNAHKIFFTDAKTAEFIKYMRNCFFATKVTYMNEMYKIAEIGGINWKDAVGGFALDGRIGHSHLDVPGHDGKFGYGGTCFPKDINALIQYAFSLDEDWEPGLLMAVDEMNLEYRGEEDWKKDVGRAVSEKK